MSNNRGYCSKMQAAPGRIHFAATDPNMPRNHPRQAASTGLVIHGVNLAYEIHLLVEKRRKVERNVLYDIHIA